MQAYDAAMLIDSAVRAVKGNVSDSKALSAALKKADFKSLRGAFKFNVNGYPIEDFYLTKVVKRADGKYQTSIVEKVLAEQRRSLCEGLQTAVELRRAAGIPIDDRDSGSDAWRQSNVRPTRNVQRQCGSIARASTHNCRRQGGRWQQSRKSQPAQL